MKTSTLFRGSATALVTPFDGDTIDWVSFASLIEYQLTEGTDALVVCGTTGESATLTYDEQLECVSFAVRQTRGRVPVIAGAGSNSTKNACRLAEAAVSAGADAVLSVTPYYNKCSPEGLYEHYKAIAAAAAVPLIVYNVPSRTGMSITPQEYLRLSEIDGITAIKEASRDIGAFAETAYLVGDVLDIYCGNDDMLLPELSLGAQGIISVASNLEPKAVKRICSYYFDGEHRRAAREFKKLYPLIKHLNSGINPAPVKHLMSERGMIKNELRLPLVPVTD